MYQLLFLFAVLTTSLNAQDKTAQLPNEYLGDWCYSADLESCVVGGDFSLFFNEGEFGISFGTEMGGYDIKVKHEQDYYILDFKAASEGEEWGSSLLLYFTDGHLFLDNETPLKKAEATKMFKCKSN